ncbi:MAG: hydroxymethylglutaryl-CoA synthase [Thermodesulfobacteriota bacterium]
MTANRFDAAHGGIGSVGIDQLAVYVPRYVLDLGALARARSVPPEKISIGLGAYEMAVAPPWEDTVTLAANAAQRLFAQGLARPEEVGLLLVATETAVDHAKPASIFVHELLGLPANCRTFELKHACYSGTAGVMIAADWLRSPASRGRKALVIAADIARYDVGSSAEFTQGAGAAAVLLSREPRLLELAPESGVHASNVYDFWRPLERREALVDGKFSLDCYLDALSGALADYRSVRNGHGDESLLERFAALLYHTPFPKMAYKAHLRLAEVDLARRLDDAERRAQEAERTYASLVEPHLAMARRVGNSYTASLYLCLAWYASQHAAALAGKEVGLFSYGSGCCAEFFTGRFTERSATAARKIAAAELLDARRSLTVEEYERCAGSRAGEPPTSDGAGAFFFAGVRDDKRQYARTTTAAAAA